MEYENKSISEIYGLIVAGLEQSFNTRFRLLPKAFITVLAKVLSGVFIILYKLNGWFFLQIFVNYAYFGNVTVQGKSINPLVEWGRLVGVGDPGEATQWQGAAEVEVVSGGTSLLSGTQLRSSVTGKIYLIENTVLLSGVTVSVQLLCTEAGTAGNLEIGDELQFVNPIGTVGRTAIVTSLVTKATDAETEVTYRERVKARFKSQPQGGALADYRRWASEVPGVYQTYIYTDDESPAGVIIYVAGDPDVYPDRIVPSSVLKKVGETCTYNPETGIQDRKPMGAVLDPDFNESYKNIRAVEVSDFDVYVIGLIGVDLADFTSQARANVKLYFMDREPYIRGLSTDNDKKNVITKVNVIGILNEVAIGLKSSFTSVDIKKDGVLIEDAGYTLGKGELSELNHFYINGVEV